MKSPTVRTSRKSALHRDVVIADGIRAARRIAENDAEGRDSFVDGMDCNDGLKACVAAKGLAALVAEYITMVRVNDRRRANALLNKLESAVRE